jgi:hypothetical protein
MNIISLTKTIYKRVINVLYKRMMVCILLRITKTGNKKNPLVGLSSAKYGSTT